MKLSKALTIASVCVLLLASLFAGSYVRARRAAVLFLDPIFDLLEYNSTVVCPIGTDASSPSFILTYRPKWMSQADGTWLIFYIEVSIVGGQVKTALGPYTDNLKGDFTFVRANLLKLKALHLASEQQENDNRTRARQRVDSRMKTVGTK